LTVPLAQNYLEETMLNKLVLSYLGGASTIAGAVYAAGGRATVVSFGIGLLFAVLILIIALSSARRQRCAARQLNALANMIDAEDRTRKKKKEPEAPASQVEIDVTAALINFGASKAQAARLAHQAAGFGEPFEQAFKRALALRKVAA